MISSVDVGRGSTTAATTNDRSQLRDPITDLMTLDLPHNCTTFSLHNEPLSKSVTNTYKSLYALDIHAREKFRLIVRTTFHYIHKATHHTYSYGDQYCIHN